MTPERECDVGVSDKTEDAARYQLLSSEQAASINAKLVEIVGLRHAGRLTEAQLAELTACMDRQTRDAESLHRFALTNADEPAFIRAAFKAGRR